MGIEPTSQPWEGRILPMNYTRMRHGCIISKVNQNFNYYFDPFFDKFYSSPAIFAESEQAGDFPLCKR